MSKLVVLRVDSLLTKHLTFSYLPVYVLSFSYEIKPIL
jgi:hypothetical protein